jgi:DNA-binding response OmpR family regulator
MRVLLIEDSPVVRGYLLRWLVADGHEVRLAQDTASWVDWEPDVLLVDWHPWGRRALELARLHTPTARVIVISGADEWEVREWVAGLSGEATWLPKPFGVESLREALGGSIPPPGR